MLALEHGVLITKVSFSIAAGGMDFGVVNRDVCWTALIAWVYGVGGQFQLVFSIVAVLVSGFGQGW